MTSSYVKSVDVPLSELKKLPSSFAVTEDAQVTEEQQAEQRKQLQDERRRIRKKYADAKRRREETRLAEKDERERAMRKKLAKLDKQILAIDAAMDPLFTRERILAEKIG